MQKIFTLFVCLFIVSQGFSQSQHKVSTYLLTQYNKTIHDYTLGNNPWGVGLGLQTFLNNKTNFKPTIELTGDIYLEDDKVWRPTPGGGGSLPAESKDLGGVINLFAGVSYSPAQNIYLSIAGGPSFSNGQTLLGIKPSIGFYFSKSQRWMGKISYINIFNRTEIIKEDFGSLSLAFGVKLF